MKRIGWIALLGAGLMVVGCAKPEPGKPADGARKPVPAPAKVDDNTPPPASEPTEPAPSGAAKAKAEPATPPDKAGAETGPPQGKGNMTGTLGKALWKGFGGSDAKPAAPKEEAPTFQP